MSGDNVIQYQLTSNKQSIDMSTMKVLKHSSVNKDEQLTDSARSSVHINASSTVDNLISGKDGSTQVDRFGSTILRATNNMYSQEIPQSKRAYLKWEYINFFAPAPMSAEDRDVNEVTGSVMHNIMEVRKQTSEKKFKQILSNCTGFVNPGELVAIMGPSGSGKTSLLNIIACRLTVSKSSYFTGKLKCNNYILNKDNFGIFGAYVQQDDILIETMTPKELFTFAAQMKLGEDSKFPIASKVAIIIKKLKLSGC